MTMPERPSSPDNRFVATEYATAKVVSAEGLLEFCKSPRTKREIYLHFGLSSFQLKPIFDLATADGRLLCTDPTNPKNHWQRFVAADSEQANITDEAVERFCMEVRTRAELVAFLGCEKGQQKKYIHSYINKGIIKMLKPEKPTSSGQRFISTSSLAEYEPTKREYKPRVNRGLILNTETIQEFCRTPRTRQEVADHFGLKIYTARLELKELVKRGKLKTTIPLTPEAHLQRYAHPDIEILQLSEEALLEYCKTPRRREDIYNHFKSAFTGSLVGFTHLLYPLINAGKLKRTELIGNRKTMKFVAAE